MAVELLLLLGVWVGCGGGVRRRGRVCIRMHVVVGSVVSVVGDWLRGIAVVRLIILVAGVPWMWVHSLRIHSVAVHRVWVHRVGVPGVGVIAV